MDMIYCNETLFVNLHDKLTQKYLATMQKRVFRVIEDYDISNIVLKANGTDNRHLDHFAASYHKKHAGNLKIL